MRILRGIQNGLILGLLSVISVFFVSLVLRAYWLIAQFAWSLL